MIPSTHTKDAIAHTKQLDDIRVASGEHVVGAIKADDQVAARPGFVVACCRGCDGGRHRCPIRSRAPRSWHLAWNLEVYIYAGGQRPSLSASGGYERTSPFLDCQRRSKRTYSACHERQAIGRLNLPFFVSEVCGKDRRRSRDSPSPAKLCRRSLLRRSSTTTV